ncbi:MAG: hypothetical protein IH934_00760 [Nanoarchaeota archaeon]|nr:hypothetical protein [Nanoarchaeota archaeon]
MLLQPYLKAASKSPLWVADHYEPKQDPVSLVCSNQLMLEIFVPLSRHTVFYQPTKDQQLIASIRQDLSEREDVIIDYGKLGRDKLSNLSFATGSVLEPPFEPGTFDNVYFDLGEMGTRNSRGFGWREPWQNSLIALAEYVEKLKSGGHLFSRVPIASAAAADYVTDVVSRLVEQYAGSEVEQKEVLKSEYKGDFVYDLMIKVRKKTHIDAKAIRERTKQEDFELDMPEFPIGVPDLSTNTVLVTTDADLEARLN